MFLVKKSNWPVLVSIRRLAVTDFSSQISFPDLALTLKQNYFDLKQIHLKRKATVILFRPVYVPGQLLQRYPHVVSWTVFSTSLKQASLHNISTDTKYTSIKISQIIKKCNRLDGAWFNNMTGSI